jgi:hypothetical protein
VWVSRIKTKARAYVQCVFHVQYNEESIMQKWPESNISIDLNCTLQYCTRKLKIGSLGSFNLIFTQYSCTLTASVV